MTECLYCRAPFYAKRPWQKFCCGAHKDAYHAAARRDGARLRSHVAALEEALALALAQALEREREDRNA